MSTQLRDIGVESPLAKHRGAPPSRGAAQGRRGRALGLDHAVERRLELGASRRTVPYRTPHCNLYVPRHTYHKAHGM